jgi:hypothetical protein
LQLKPPEISDLMQELRLVVLALQDRLAYGSTFEAAQRLEDLKRALDKLNTHH